MLMEDFENKIVDLFNSTPLPFEAKRYVMLKVMRDIEDTYAFEKKKKMEEEVKQTQEGSQD